MVFQVPAAKKSIGQNKFEFQIPGEDKTYAIPLIKYIKPSVVAEAQMLPAAAGVKRLLDEVAPGVFDKLEQGSQVDALFDAWSEESDIDLGESSASAS